MDDYARKQIEQLLEVEGFYANDPDDPGGETMLGITKKYYPKEFAEIMSLKTRKEQVEYAIKFYYEKYWLAIPETLPNEIIALCFDASVNMRADEPIEILQIALQLLHFNNVEVDGDFGNITLRATLQAYTDSKNRLILATQLARAYNYGIKVGKKPIKEKYRKSWLRRILEMEV